MNGKPAVYAHEPANGKADNLESVVKVAPVNDETRAQSGGGESGRMQKS